MPSETFAIVWIFANLTALVLFGFDKVQARGGGWRVPERHLLLACLFGGLGAMAASSLFRHKTRKQPFRRYAVGLSALHLVICAFMVIQLY